MQSYTSDQLKALLSGQISPEQESAIARDIEIDPKLRSRLEMLSGSDIWKIGSAPVPNDPDSAKLQNVIERVVSESRIERISGSRGIVDDDRSDVTDKNEPLLIPGIRIVREIGRGGMGVVYEGWDELVGRKVAIKQLLAIRSSGNNAKERLLQEARAAGSLLHPNIVSIYGVHVQDDMPILIQQFVEGETLQSRIDSKPVLSWQECIELAKQIASGLEAAHAAGIVHRDLKPDNILIEKGTNLVRIADFGIAKHSSSSGLTVNDKVAGTPAYMSPEQTGGETLDARSDLFSLGSVLFAAATGTPPFGLDDPFVVMDRIRNQQATRLRAIQPACPAWLDKVVNQLLQKERVKRISSASELSSVLQLGAISKTPYAAMSNAKAMLAVGFGIAAIYAILFLWPRYEIEGRFTDGQNSAEPTAADSSKDSVELNNDSSVSFAPSKPLWIRRDFSQYDSLSDAINAAIDGDVIEIGADLECDPITIRGKKITLRGGANQRPVLRSANPKSNGANSEAYFLRSESDLTLDGIEIEWIASAQMPLFDEKRINAVVGAAPGTRLVLNNCKIIRSEGGVCLATGGNLEMRRTYVEGASIALAWLGHHSISLMEDSVLNSRVGIAVVYPIANATVYSRSNLKIRHCTVRATDAVSAMLSRRPDEPVQIESYDSIFDCEHAVSMVSLSTTAREQIESLPIAVFRSSLAWTDERCVFESKCQFLIARKIKNLERPIRTNVSSLDQWFSIRQAEGTTDETRSIIAKMVRSQSENQIPIQSTYTFELQKESQPPTWLDQVGPALLRQPKR